MSIGRDGDALEILLVEDNPGDVRLAAEALREVKVPVALKVVEDGVRAVGFLREQLKRPDLVLTDLQMPWMIGLELVEHIKNTYPSIPVILMTAFGNEEIALRALQMGAASYVPKRNVFRGLPETIERLLDLVRADRHRRRVLECLTHAEAEYVLDNDTSLILPLVRHLQENLARSEICDPTERIRVGVALHEALVNAIEHGNLEVDSSLREEDMSRYYRLTDERRKRPPYRDRRVHVTVRESRSEVVYRIRDEGPGFDPTTLPDPTDLANLSRVTGRGLFLIRTFLDEVQHNSRGNEITMIKRRRQCRADLEPG